MVMRPERLDRPGLSLRGEITLLENEIALLRGDLNTLTLENEAMQEQLKLYKR